MRWPGYLAYQYKAERLFRRDRSDRRSGSEIKVSLLPSYSFLVIKVQPRGLHSNCLSTF